MSANRQHDRLQVLMYYLSIGKRPKELGGGGDGEGVDGGGEERGGRQQGEEVLVGRH